MPTLARWRFRYIGTIRSRIWRRFLPAAVIALALPAGGCSFSYQLGSLFGKDDERKPEMTGSVATNSPAQPTAELPPDNDLVFARAAASEALAKDGQTTSVPCENPRTGARGTVTPIASSYTQDGFVCRDFLASYVRQGTESWLQGEACRLHRGRWEIRAMRPWKKS
jgi:surface antigen